MPVVIEAVIVKVKNMHIIGWVLISSGIIIIVMLYTVFIHLGLHNLIVKNNRAGSNTTLKGTGSCCIVPLEGIVARLKELIRG